MCLDEGAPGPLEMALIEPFLFLTIEIQYICRNKNDGLRYFLAHFTHAISFRFRSEGGILSLMKLRKNNRSLQSRLFK